MLNELHVHRQSHRIEITITVLILTEVLDLIGDKPKIFRWALPESLRNLLIPLAEILTKNSTEDDCSRHHRTPDCTGDLGDTDAPSVAHGYFFAAQP